MFEAQPRVGVPVSITRLLEFLVGPIICRDGGYAFDTYSSVTGLKRGFLYRRVEQAQYDRKAMLGGNHLPNGHTAHGCDTASEFVARCGTVGFMPEAALAS